MTMLQTFYQEASSRMTGLSFLLVVLPMFLFLYYIAPIRVRPVVMLAVSGFYLYIAAGGGNSLQVMAGSLLIDYAVLRIMVRMDKYPLRRKLCLWFVVGKNLLYLIVVGAMIQISAVPQMVGLQVYVLSSIDCALSLYRRESAVELHFVRFSAYCAFFPRMYVGPLLPYDDFASQLEGVRLDVTAVLRGLGRYIQGAAKTVILGGSLFRLYQSIEKISQVTVLSAWCLVFTLAFALYYMLSGYSDMARGIGEMFGIKLPQNFYYPYQSRNVQDFFERFNMTVTAFLRRTVYSALGEDRHGPFADSLNIMAVGMLLGLWFGLRVNYVVWGAYLALFVIFERYAFRRLLEKVPILFGRILTLGAVLSSFTIFSGDSLMGSVRLIGSMFRFSSVVNDQILYLLSSNWLLLLTSCVLATNGVSLLAARFRESVPRFSTFMSALLNLALLLLYVALSV